MLSGLVAPPRSAPANLDDGLEDDIASISYEHALRAHARTRQPTPTSFAASPAAAARPEARPSASPEQPPFVDPRFGPNGRKPPMSVRISEWAPELPAPGPRSAAAANAAVQANRKQTSVTVRLSAAESTQLHERAAAAGLTASAYLRSCLFEAETLRAQVKEAVEQFQHAVPLERSLQTATPVAAVQPPAQQKTIDAAVAMAAQTRHSWLQMRWLGGSRAKTA